MSADRHWIGTIPSRASKTVIVRASSRKEAEHKLRHPTEFFRDIIGVDVEYHNVGIGRIHREDKKLPIDPA